MEHKILIEKLTHGPYGLGHDHGKVILVPRTAPGDVAEVHIAKDRKRYALGELISLIEAGQARTTPPCPYAERCGGCAWQQVDYETQLSSKQKNVADALDRIAKLAGFEILPILRGSQPYHYRRRIRLHVGARGIGFHRLLSREIVPVESCLIAHPAISNHIPLARDWLKVLTTPVISVEILWSEAARVLLVGKASRSFHETDTQTCREFYRGHGDLAGIVLSGYNWRRHWGEDQIPYSLDQDTYLRVDADAFSQVNVRGNQLLIGELMSWAGFDKQERVLELYSGAGNLTIPIARRAGKVVAIDTHEGLVRNGEQNSRRHGLDNVEWRCQSARSGVVELVQRQSSFTSIVLNPPRSGAKEVIRDLARFSARRIFYVACDPVTMARDVAQLSEFGYRLQRIRPVDLFPQTHHVEILAELEIGPPPRSA
jgi:23S rRNA (uracil1939-C5)-methyltransferase